MYNEYEKAIPLVYGFTVGGIPNCLHVPTLEIEIVSLLHMDVEIKWCTLIESGACVVDNRRSDNVKFTWAFSNALVCVNF